LRQRLRERLQGVDWSRALADVRTFLEVGEDAGLLTEENLKRVVG
jgi:hypothetical protein